MEVTCWAKSIRSHIEFTKSNDSLVNVNDAKVIGKIYSKFEKIRNDLAFVESHNAARNFGAGKENATSCACRVVMERRGDGGQRRRDRTRKQSFRVSSDLCGPLCCVEQIAPIPFHALFKRKRVPQVMPH